jgi:dTDP-4-dehydrorhamnose 3,5-epimerase
MHHQVAPFTQGKILTLIKGRIVDFAVSILPENFGETSIFEMNPGDRVYIPRGYLHGFFVYDNQEAIVQYMVDNKYNKLSEISVDWKTCPVVKEWIESDAKQWGYNISDIELSSKDINGISLETLRA